MSTLSLKHQQYLAMTDDTSSVNLPEGQTNNENMAELMKFIQTHNSSQGSSQSTGARGMIKAGQRRLRLALRNKKGADSKAKADDTSRQLLALQQEGYLSASLHRRSGHKKSLESTGSISRSITSLSFKSSSKRDVESIGQPWLGDPLEEKESPGSKGSFSSLDLRELTELVEAAVSFSPNFEDINPPPYQSSTEWNNPHSTEQPTKQDSTTPSPQEGFTAIEPQRSDQAGAPSNSNPPNLTSQNAVVDLSESQPQSNGDRVPDNNQNSGPSPLQEVKAKGPSPSKLSVSSATQQSSNPPTPVLKLFPDTMPPRISSKGALRIATSRSPAPNRPLPTAPGSQKSALPALVEASSQDSKSFHSKQPNKQDQPRVPCNPDRTIPPQQAEPSKSLADSPIFEKFPRAKNSRRPCSLPMGTIDAFPLPAPIRPLPSLPEPTPWIHITREVRSVAPTPTPQPDTTHPELDPPFNSPPTDDSKASSVSYTDCSSPDRTTAPTRLILGAKEPASSQSSPKETGSPNQPRRALVKAGKNRAERVHSLKMKDLSASRLYLNGEEITRKIEEPPSEPHGAPQTTVSTTSDDSRAVSDRRYQRKVAPGPQSPPPLSPPPCDPPRQFTQAHVSSRRHCTSPAIGVSETLGARKSLSRPLSKRSSRVCRGDSTQRAGVKHEGLTVQSIPCDRSETPIPSSDDEGTAGGTHRSHPPRMSTRRRRRAKPVPIIVDEPSQRGRSLKKYQSSGNISPLTPHEHRTHGEEKTKTLQQSPNIYQSHGPHGSHGHHQQESKAGSSLEGRIEHLERQNKILQAALLAALDVGVRQDLSSILGGSTASLSTNATPPLTGRSCSSTTNTSSCEELNRGRERQTRNRKPNFRPESWIASPDSFGRDSYTSDDSANARALEDMIEDFDLDWMSDKSNTESNQVSRVRF